MTPPVVLPYDPAWPVLFAQEARLIETALGEALDGPVEHIGSTSIPGMDAKPILDMMAPVGSLDVGRHADRELGALGYAVRPHRVDAVRYVKPDTDDVLAVTHHLHLTTRDSELWHERLAFRDTLRADAGLREEYRDLKQQLLEQTGGRVYDSAAKRDFVRRVLASAGHELRDGLHSPDRRTPGGR